MQDTSWESKSQTNRTSPSKFDTVDMIII